MARFLAFLCGCLAFVAQAQEPPKPPQAALKYRAELTRLAHSGWGLDAPVPMFAAQIHQESGWNPEAVSRVGAKGMPSIKPLLFTEAIDYFRAKTQLPSASWTDIWQEQHSHAFVVAGATQDALVSDFYNAIKKAQTEGTGYAAFRASFDEIVARHGWSYNGAPGWRSKVIYQTNISQAYNAGRTQQMQAVKHLRPYWRYVHTSIEHPRLQHLAWDGLILPADDSWFDTNMPQNGWHCKCRVDSLSRYEAEEEWQKSGKTGPDSAPEIIWEERVVGKTGANPRTVLTPEGIDPGFGYNPGKAWLEPHTVPPLTGHDAVLKERGTPWPTGFAPPSLPAPTRVPASSVLPASTAPELAVSDFLAVFGADTDKGAVFTDATGSPLAISKALFQDGTGAFKWLAKPEKADRLRYVNLMAMTIIEPDEIWWAWEEDRLWSATHPDAAKQWRLKRRSLRAFEVEGSGEYGVSAFEWSNNGWGGSTTFMAEPSNAKARLKYFDKQRVGRLIYKK